MNQFINGEYVNKNIWGTTCGCGEDVHIFVDEHPWSDADISYKVKCYKCGKIHNISTKQAAIFYEEKIYSLFSDVKGKVLELGSGGGFITKFLSNKKDVSYICAIDIDDEENKYANKYIRGDINCIGNLNINETFDYVVCRDVFMYLDKLDEIFYELSKISTKILFVNWYNPNHKNCHNKMNPGEVYNLLKMYFEDIEMSYPLFYKWGYLIRSK